MGVTNVAHARLLLNRVRTLRLRWPLFPPGLPLHIAARRRPRTIEWTIAVDGRITRICTPPRGRAAIRPIESSSRGEAAFLIRVTRPLIAISGLLDDLPALATEAAQFRRFALEHPDDPDVVRHLRLWSLVLAAGVDPGARSHVRRHLHRVARLARSRFFREVGTVVRQLERVADP